jgi:hypothetical protein
MKRYLIIVITFWLSGCKKQLDALPNDALVEGNAITNQQTANTALNGVYYRFANANATQTDWLKNELEGGLVTGFLDDGNNTLNETKNNLASTNFGNTEWSVNYNILNSANGVIDGVNNLNASLFANGRKSQILAEAKFMRAWSHYKLLSWFGQWWDINSPYGAILRKNFITSTTIAQDRSGVKDSYDFILDDINYAVDSAAYTSSNVYVNRYTAMALKMRILLNRGQAGDYAQVITLADTIINNSPYKLETNLKDIFYTKGLSSTEVMLGIKPQSGQEAYYYNTSGCYVSRNAYYVATQALNDLLAEDPRQAWIIGPAGIRKKGFYFLKYVTPSLTTTTTSEVAYAFRLSEVYLMQAEAIARSGGDLDVAKTILKTILTHAGVTNTTTVDAAVTAEEVETQIYYEWVRNFVGEDDMSYFALLRFPLATVTQLRPTITGTNQYIYPIPHTEFLNNPSLGEQNPGYAK